MLISWGVVYWMPNCGSDFIQITGFLVEVGMKAVFIVWKMSIMITLNMQGRFALVFFSSISISLFNSTHWNCLTLKGLITTTADGTLNVVFFYFSEKKRLEISDASHEITNLIFSEKITISILESCLLQICLAL